MPRYNVNIKAILRPNCSTFGVSFEDLRDIFDKLRWLMMKLHALNNILWKKMDFPWKIVKIAMSKLVIFELRYLSCPGTYIAQILDLKFSVL